LRMAPQDSASTFSTRVTSGAVMEQMPGHFNMNTTIGKAPRCAGGWLTLA
jgi:hypothetical protein